MERKPFLILLPVFMLVLAGIACGSGDSNATETSKADTEAVLEEAVLEEAVLEDYNPPVPTTNDNARLRAGPGTEYQQVGRAPQGTALTVIGRNAEGDWLLVENPSGGQAWIAAFLVSNIPDLDTLPIVPAPPLPMSQQSISTEPNTNTSPQTNPNAFTCIGGCAEPPDPSCVIKGNVNPSAGTKIYHTPASRWYDRTDIKPEEGDRWFCTEEEARAAGFRPPRR